VELIRQMLAAGGVLLLLAGSLWWLRRRGLATLRGGSQRHLKAVERLALGPQHALYLIHFGGRGMLVGISPAGCTVLENFSWPPVKTGEVE
jgi:flagellar biosynthetic protein FliO